MALCEVGVKWGRSLALFSEIGDFAAELKGFRSTQASVIFCTLDNHLKPNSSLNAQANCSLSLRIADFDIACEVSVQSTLFFTLEIVLRALQFR